MSVLRRGRCCKDGRVRRPLQDYPDLQVDKGGGGVVYNGIIAINIINGKNGII
jgi:hypothetical protein